MDEPVNVIFGNSFRNPLSPLDVHVSITKIFRGILPSDQVEDYVGVSYTFLDGLSVSQVKLQKVDSAQITRKFEVPLRHLFPIRHDDHASLSSQPIDDIATQETSSTEHRGRVSPH